MVREIAIVVMPHRIVHVIPSLDRSGAEKQLVLLATRLPRAEWDVHVVVLSRDGPLREPLEAAGIEVTVIGKRRRFDPLAVRRLVGRLKELRPALVQTWLFAGNSYGRVAARLAGVPVIVAGERSVDPWKNRWQFWLDRWLARSTQRIVVNSTGTREFYVAHGLPSEKFVVIPNAVQTAQPPDRSREQLLTELELPLESRLIGAIGRLWPQKRVHDLIWAADLLKVVRRDVHLLIVGDGPLRKKLEKFRRQVDIEDHVHFLGHRADVSRWLAHLDLLWLGSGYEGQPNVVLEAMAAGVPVVATDIPGTRDLVVPDATGYLVPVGDRAAFARRSQQILNDADLAARLGDEGKHRALAEFSVERMVERYVTLYRDLLGPRSPSPSGRGPG